MAARDALAANAPGAAAALRDELRNVAAGDEPATVPSADEGEENNEVPSPTATPNGVVTETGLAHELLIVAVVFVAIGMVFGCVLGALCCVLCTRRGAGWGVPQIGSNPKPAEPQRPAPSEHESEEHKEEELVISAHDIRLGTVTEIEGQLSEGSASEC